MINLRDYSKQKTILIKKKYYNLHYVWHIKRLFLDFVKGNQYQTFRNNIKSYFIFLFYLINNSIHRYFSRAQCTFILNIWIAKSYWKIRLFWSSEVFQYNLFNKLIWTIPDHFNFFVFYIFPNFGKFLFYSDNLLLF
jgi:hypothetical protein